MYLLGFSSSRTQYPIPDMTIVSEIINYVKPYIQKLQFVPTSDDITKRFNEKTGVETVIDAKIKELKPLFQDGTNTVVDDIEEYLELEGNEETTIVEFSPKALKTNGLKETNHETDSFQANIKKYKKMRNKIKLALEKESISNKTKKIITRTLDEMIAKIVEKQCPRNSDPSRTLRTNLIENLLNGTDYHNCTIKNKPINKEDCRLAVKNVIDTLDLEPNLNQIPKLFNEIFKKTNFNLMNAVIKTVSNILRDSKTVSDKYKVRCKVIDMDKVNTKKALRQQDKCYNIRICSEEFRGYLIDLHRSLNDTAVGVFRNYAAMYAKDVNNDDTEEKKIVINLINKISFRVERRVHKGFTKRTSSITLDNKKDRVANIKAIKDFVTKTIQHVAKNINKHLEDDLSPLRTKLLLAIKKDININLDVELGNVEQSFIEKICSFFVTCNGEISGLYRKKYDYNKKEVNPRSVYVKVQLTLDKELKGKIFDIQKGILGNNQSEKSTNFVVTRTTMKVFGPIIEANTNTTQK